jgi:two-component system, OmpR family, sensor kinase
VTDESKQALWMKVPKARPSDGSDASRSALEELQQRNAELEAAVAARDTFIAVAAHELRNPMTPMIGQIDLLLNGLRVGRYPPQQIEQRLQRVQQVMNQYLKRAATLLDVSRITTGKLKLEPVPFDLSVLVREIVETFNAAARHAGTSIGIDTPASLAGKWDQLAMEQIIDNLVSNAIKYGARRPIEVCVEERGDKVCIQIRDHGPGISVNDRSRIFGRFERAVGSDERRSGFGIGLWVVGQLVDAMGGTIKVDDAEGGGSVFIVTLPRYVNVVGL